MFYERAEAFFTVKARTRMRTRLAGLWRTGYSTPAFRGRSPRIWQFLPFGRTATVVHDGSTITGRPNGTRYRPAVPEQVEDGSMRSGGATGRMTGECQRCVV
jgi:hypothetical protein